MVPKISASSVKEHHEIMFEKLVDAAEEILRGSGPDALTAGAVASRTGIARNSIYRYVASVDDLRILVLERYLPKWQERAYTVIDESLSPLDQLVALVEISLVLGKETGHQWLIDVLRSARMKGYRLVTSDVDPSLADDPKSTMVVDFHRDLAARITALWREVDTVNADINSRVTRSLMDAGLRAIDDGIELDKVTLAVTRALRALPVT